MLSWLFSDQGTSTHQDKRVTWGGSLQDRNKGPTHTFIFIHAAVPNPPRAIQGGRVPQNLSAQYSLIKAPDLPRAACWAPELQCHDPRSNQDGICGSSTTLPHSIRVSPGASHIHEGRQASLLDMKAGAVEQVAVAIQAMEQSL